MRVFHIEQHPRRRFFLFGVQSFDGGSEACINRCRLACGCEYLYGIDSRCHIVGYDEVYRTAEIHGGSSGRGYDGSFGGGVGGDELRYIGGSRYLNQNVLVLLVDDAAIHIIQLECQNPRFIVSRLDDVLLEYVAIGYFYSLRHVQIQHISLFEGRLGACRQLYVGHCHCRHIVVFRQGDGDSLFLRVDGAGVVVQRKGFDGGVFVQSERAAVVIAASRSQ